MRFTAPSKTFLTGEYAVLYGSPALVLNTQPRFELLASKGEGVVEGIPAGSPAALWLKQREPLLKDWKIEFRDPHAGRGGLGASSAQFLLAHAFTTALQGGTETVDAVWNDYQVLTNKSGSGADVIGQFTGEIARMEFKPLLVEMEEWPYPEVGFAIARTGEKIATHEHLKTLDRDRVQPLVPLAEKAYDSFDAESVAQFLVNVKHYGRALREFGLQAPTTMELLDAIEKEEWCLAAKGCGAYGADTLIAFYPIDDRQAALLKMKDLKLEVVATESDLSGGLEVLK